MSRALLLFPDIAEARDLPDVQWKMQSRVLYFAFSIAAARAEKGGE